MTQRLAELEELRAQVAAKVQHIEKRLNGPIHAQAVKERDGEIARLKEIDARIEQARRPHPPARPVGVTAACGCGRLVMGEVLRRCVAFYCQDCGADWKQERLS